jgi:hypothetical protein
MLAKTFQRISFQLLRHKEFLPEIHLLLYTIYLCVVHVHIFRLVLSYNIFYMLSVCYVSGIGSSLLSDDHCSNMTLLSRRLATKKTPSSFSPSNPSNQRRSPRVKVDVLLDCLKQIYTEWKLF